MCMYVCVLCVCCVCMCVLQVFYWYSLTQYCKLMGTDALTSSSGGSGAQDVSPAPDSTVRL